MSLFKKATKHKRKLRLAIFGASGSGKTYSALRIATGIGGSIALIDTENSAELYADKFDFDVVNLKELNMKPDIDTLINIMDQAKDYKVLIVDSFSHAWKELLDDVNRIAKGKFQGNTHAAWMEGTPKQQKLVNAILNNQFHLIVCMRSKTEWMIEKDERTGKNKPVRVGLAPVQGKDIEFEFDMLMEINPEHYVTVLKDRTGKYQDKIIEKPGEDFGKDLINWLNVGEEPPPPPKPEINQKQFAAALDRIKHGETELINKLQDTFTIPDVLLKELQDISISYEEQGAA